MADQLPIGPYCTIDMGNNSMPVPFYIIPFDEEGRCQGPLTRDQLLFTAQNGTYTDVFLFSPGWNDDWRAATTVCNTFLQGYTQMRSRHGLNYPQRYQPLLVGIFWPSTALVMPWESAPTIAGLSPDDPKATDLR